MTKKFKMTAATLKKAGKELEEILVPTDDDGNPLKIAVKDQEEMKAKIIEGGNELTPEDEISANLTSVLAELGVSIRGAEETVEKDKETDSKVEESDEVVWTWDVINSMNKKKLIELCEKMDLVTDSGDYDELKDFRTDVAIELELEIPETVEEELEKDTKEKVKEIEITAEDNESEIKETNDEEEVDLGVLVTGTKKLAHLKEICEIHDDFKKLRKGLKKYKGLSGPRELKPKMLKLLGIEPEEVKVKPKSEKKKESSGKPAVKKVGVIATIIKCICNEPSTKEDILKALVEKFPDREEASMKKTINVQVPNRIKKEKNDSLDKDDKGRWFFAKGTDKAGKTKK